MEGTKIVDEILLQERYSVAEIYATADWFAQREFSPPFDWRSSKPPQYPDTWRQSPKLELVTESELKRISGLSTPHQVLAVASPPELDLATSLVNLNRSWSLYLDGLQQPANLGAILRVADWFGFENVVVGPDTVDPYNPKSIQASMGSFLRVDCFAASLENIKAAHPDLPIIAADLDGESIFRFQPPPIGVLVIGREGRGISTNVRDTVDQFLVIPRAKDRRAESLNAAVAAGVLCGVLREGGG